ncbi:hypothetical protein N7456_000157 [Penicillium angulare]|uniref:Uncharacterized protein n=1 Tax=Penicillium angulare TaxID=116970 RepID=A0A9W9GBM0_9EURO|nr:hypothetical protein N7456_000157 [Penicillium angulare]
MVTRSRTNTVGSQDEICVECDHRSDNDTGSRVDRWNGDDSGNENDNQTLRQSSFDRSHRSQETLLFEKNTPFMVTSWTANRCGRP